ncbi:MAG: hypothetical protein CL878_11710 [Dehalococcoidia bacterium]|nr:hypothetical protein [Dehalococcoidia bacterium]
MSSHGRSGLSRWVYGSVAHKIVHYSPVPILVIRNTVVPGHNGTPGRPPFRSKQIRSILVPLDGSALAAEALAPATRLAASMSATLVLMQVVTPPYIIPAEYLVPGSHVLSEWDRHHAAISYLHEVRETLQSQDLHVTTEVIEGDPAHEITTYAEQHDVDLIAMSTHGRMGLSRWLIGSVTERVLHSAAVPLLVTRPDLTREWQPTNNNKTTIAAGG